MKLATSARVVNGIYYLALATWFGSMVMMAIGAAVTFKTLAALGPDISTPPYNHPSFAGRVPAIIAGVVTGRVIQALVIVETICALVIVVCTALQCGVLSDRLIVGRVRSKANYFRLAALAFPIVLLMIESVYVAPRAFELRDTMYNVDISESQRAAAHEKFKKVHRLNTEIAAAITLSLGAAIFLSGFALADGDPETQD